jgi:2-dehydropantoate 2-reductase
MKKTINEIESLGILGAGAVGSFYGCKLQKFGIKTEFQSQLLTREKVQKLNIKSIWGNFSLPIAVFSDPNGMSKSDLIIISTKIIDIEEDMEKLQSWLKYLLKPNSIILLLQNGINIEEKLQISFPNHAILGGLAFTCINRVSPNKIEHIDYGKIKIGSNLNKHNEIAKKVVLLFKNAGIDCDYLPSLRMGRYEKLLWNVPFNSLSVLFKSKTDMLIKEDTTRILAYNLMVDIYKIARKDNIPLNKKIIPEMIERTIKMKPYKTSMLLDYQAKRKLEIETILGEPLRIAMKYKLKVPYLENIYYILKHIQVYS